jgi:transcription termination factor Rho
MSVLDRAALEDSPLADLHALASELSIDGYRRLRRAALIDAILERGGGDPGSTTAVAVDAEAEAEGDEDGDGDADAPSGPARRRRGRRGGRGRASSRDDAAGEDEDEPAPARRRQRAPEPEPEPEPASARRRQRATEPEPEPEPEPEDVLVEGTVELLPNGSGFVRVTPPDPSDEDVYISAAQVKRCELVTGDRVTGPRRAPRRSERFASLVRIDTINDRPASELADGLRYDELPAAFPSERFRLASEDPTLKAIEWLTPIGRGSRVTITGAARAGKSEALRGLAVALATHEDLQVFVALAGVRPEEISEWVRSGSEPAAAVSFAASSDAQDHAVELVVDQARRIAARGGHAVVAIDTLDYLHPHTARKLLAAARNIVDGGSLTVIATSTQPLGGETTVIALDQTLTSTGRLPALDLVGSGTVRPELLVGEAGAHAIGQARLEALG